MHNVISKQKGDPPFCFFVEVIKNKRFDNNCQIIIDNASLLC